MTKPVFDLPPLAVAGSEVRPFPKIAGKNALREASADDLRVLLCFLENGTDGLSDAAGVTPARTAAALEYWVEAGILTSVNMPTAEETEEIKKKAVLCKANELDSVDSKETVEIIRRRNLASMIEDAQRLAGRMFNTSEIILLSSLCDQLELDPVYVLMLYGWCVGRGKKSLRYMERTAFSLVQEGVSDVESLESYITRKEQAETPVGQIKDLFGFANRSLSKNEAALFERWTLDDKFPIEVIGIAYDITVNNTGKASAAYADKILTNWKENGVAGSVEEVEAFIEKEKEERKNQAVNENALNGKKKAAPEITSTFDTDEFFKKALERSYNKK